MRVLFSSLFLLFTGFLNAQTFEIPAEGFPFYEVLEWKGQGAILLNRDPSLNQKQVYLTLVANDGKSSWNENFSPGGKEFFYISEDAGRYVYFLEHLELKSGKISFHQLNIAGNIKSNAVSFTAALKKIGDFPADELILLDIVTSEKALIYLFSHTDKATKKKSTIAITMTHNNFLVYATLVAQNVTGSNKVEDQVSWYMAGETGESIVYAARTHAGKDAGWLVKQFTPKGVLQSEFTIPANKMVFLEHARVGFGTRGSALLKRVEPVEKGTLVVNNGTYYVGGVEMAGSNANLVTYVLKDNEWVKSASSPVSGYNVKKGLELGYYPMLEGIGWYVKSTTTEGHFHSYTNATGIVSGAVNQQTNNPSRLLTAEFTGKFVASLATRWLVFAASQLPSKGAVSFEYVEK
ncbi:MAG: hypothetical protein A3D31_13945 [Candidatus Fluviicola riflensis]|nr:MAG: hypothetical protein CHH17_18380 [Candidatus Fluviicola riflensis]OGS78078.1 MAG: hypothetical protein A3D31_13945 [Candidatus Fluviicola riflensis]OGS85144.1 MAG: hypothetical protein A2724_10880 [Fluviicola sp. RIFCSPHIGHO2_01_FULL_43_53]OGS89415.1 MAG: hypothetical protein A3E30_05185 [Fluviicola sp. RIFCSPHIGHO2_12_FULL_43_24]